MMMMMNAENVIDSRAVEQFNATHQRVRRMLGSSVGDFSSNTKTLKVAKRKSFLEENKLICRLSRRES